MAMKFFRIILAAGLAPLTIQPALAQDSSVVRRGDSVIVRLLDVDLRTAVSMLAPYLDRPILFGNIQPVRVTLESPRPVHQRDIERMLRAVVEAQSMELTLDSVAGVLRVKPREAARVQPPSPGPVRPQSQSGAPELFVVRLRHARATDVAAMVNVLFGKAAAVGELGAPAPTLGQELRQNMMPPVGALPQSVPGATGRSATLAGEITIVPDPSTNSLLIRSLRGDFQLVEAAIQQIDVRPLQVLIEVVIAEVRRDQQFALGLEAALPKTSVGGVTSISATNAGIGLGDFVLRIMNVGGIDADLVLRAAASRGDVKILSRPIVLAANNQTADINVGTQRPFVQVSRSLPTDAPQRDQVIQYKDVGTQLTVKPTISADGYVMLQVTQQVNQATTEVAFDAPVISTRSVQTQLLVKDGHTVVLGGMSDRQRDVNSSGIPILSRIPLIGGLFGAQSRRSSETELFLFLKPVVLFTDDDAQRATEVLRQRAGTVPPPEVPEWK
jgi:general secretion pathway protein D